MNNAGSVMDMFEGELGLIASEFEEVDNDAKAKDEEAYLYQAAKCAEINLLSIDDEDKAYYLKLINDTYNAYKENFKSTNTFGDNTATLESFKAEIDALVEQARELMY